MTRISRRLFLGGAALLGVGIVLDRVGQAPTSVAEQGLVQKKEVIAVRALAYCSMAVTRDGEVLVWGMIDARTKHWLSNLHDVIAVESDFSGWDPLVLTRRGEVVTNGYPRLPAGLSGVVQVAVGDDYSLAVTQSGEVVAWGNNDEGKFTVPAGLRDVVQVAAVRTETSERTRYSATYVGNTSYSLALTRTGEIVFWGSVDEKTRDVLTGLHDVVQISASDDFALAVTKSGGVVAWGSNSYGQIDVPDGIENIKSVSAGGRHSLALTQNGDVVAWGNNDYGQCTVPARLRDVVAVAAGWVHSLALTRNGDVMAWGFNEFLKDLSTVQGVKDIAVGRDYFILLIQDGEVLALGNTGDVPVDNSPPDGLRDVVAVVAGWAHSLALTRSGEVVAWGWNGYSQTDVPSSVRDVVAVAAGGNHSLALTRSGEVVAWGGNEYGQTDVPSGLRDVVAVEAGDAHSLILTRSGEVVAWGRLDEGQTDVPSGLRDVVYVAAGWDHSLAVTRSGEVIAWGNNSSGQTDVPSGLRDVVAVAAGAGNSLALTRTGEMIIWGENTVLPAVFATINDISNVYVNEDSVIALRRDGTIVQGWFGIPTDVPLAIRAQL